MTFAGRVGNFFFFFLWTDRCRYQSATHSCFISEVEIGTLMTTASPASVPYHGGAGRWVRWGEEKMRQDLEYSTKRSAPKSFASEKDHHLLWWVWAPVEADKFILYLLHLKSRVRLITIFSLVIWRKYLWCSQGHKVNIPSMCLSRIQSTVSEHLKTFEKHCKEQKIMMHSGHQSPKVFRNWRYPHNKVSRRGITVYIEWSCY